MFRDEQTIFTSAFNITKLLVPADGTAYVHNDFTNNIPSIFFSISDPRLEGGSCIYVLEDLTAYEVLEGGRDSTCDYGIDKTVYLGAKDGVYKYNPESLSAKKFGPFRDDIIQIQKANGTDLIYFLTSQKKLYKLENNGTVKTRLTAVTCALEFVLDTSNNIYFIGCDDGLPHIVTPEGNLVTYTASVTEDFKLVKLIRPAFIMEKSVPFFADGYIYMLYSNGTSEKKDIFVRERPSAFSIDAALYLVAALDGKIYEFNVMEVLLKSMFGFTSYWPSDLSKIIMSMIDNVRDGIHKML